MEAAHQLLSGMFHEDQDIEEDEDEDKCCVEVDNRVQNMNQAVSAKNLDDMEHQNKLEEFQTAYKNIMA